MYLMQISDLIGVISYIIYFKTEIKKKNEYILLFCLHLVGSTYVYSAINHNYYFIVAKSAEWGPLASCTMDRQLALSFGSTLQNAQGVSEASNLPYL